MDIGGIKAQKLSIQIILGRAEKTTDTRVGKRHIWHGVDFGHRFEIWIIRPKKFRFKSIIFAPPISNIHFGNWKMSFPFLE